MNESRCASFPPVADPDAKVLILGSMPGMESLLQRQYYAHPRNLFWPFMGEFFGAGLDLPYRQRIERLRTRRVALWDVLASCHRPGSLDASIDVESAQPNNIVGLLEDCPGVETIFFNGTVPEKLYLKFVQPAVKANGFDVRAIRLPSTSPANASVSRRQKRADWQQVREALG